MRRTVLFYFCLSHMLPVYGDDDHDHDKLNGPPSATLPNGNAPKVPGAQTPPSPVKIPPHEDRPRTTAPGPGPRPSGGNCRVSPGSLTSFANGENYNYGDMVTYLTSPDCREESKAISSFAIQNGVDFKTTGPFRLDGFAQQLKNNQLENSRRVEILLGQSIPNQLRINPLGSSELLPLIGQLSLLSPKAARAAMANLIEQELYQGDTQLQQLSGSDKEGVANDLARMVMTLGGTQPAIVSEISESVEDMALLSQADSLGKIFRSLSAVSVAEPSLSPTFNTTAGAFNRGIQRRTDSLGKANRKNMLFTAFTGIQSAIKGGEALEPGANELNEAMSALLQGAPLQATQLKQLWKDIIRVLAGTSSQSALAQAVGLSIKPQYVFLPADEIGKLLQASRNYPELAGALQQNFLLSWKQQWDDLHEGKLKVRTFNKLKDKIFEPLVAELLELDPYLVDPQWLHEVTRRGLVSDSDIEKRFPRLVLANLERREKAARQMVQDQGVEPTILSMSENLAVVWALSQTEVPALLRWVKKNEE